MAKSHNKYYNDNSSLNESTSILSVPKLQDQDITACNNSIIPLDKGRSSLSSSPEKPVSTSSPKVSLPLRPEVPKPGGIGSYK